MRKVAKSAALCLMLATAAMAEEKIVPASNGVEITVNSDEFADRYEYSAPVIRFGSSGQDSGFVLLAAVKSADRLSAPYISGYIYYSDDWRRYSRAIFKGGAEASFKELDRNVVSCRSKPCSLSEGFRVDVTDQQIKQHASDGKLSIQIRSQSANNFIIEVPVSYFDAIKEVSQKRSGP